MTLKIAGFIVLIGVLAVIAWWYLTGFKPEIGFIVLALSAIGITLATPISNTGEAEAKARRKKLIVVYLAFNAVAAGFILLIHLIVNNHPPLAAANYSPVIMIVGALLYKLFYVYYINPAKVEVWNKIIIPLLFYSGVLLTQLGVITLYNSYTQEIEVVETTKDLETTKSEFVNIRKIEIDKTAMIYFWQSIHDDGDYEITYSELLPLIADRDDSVYRTWIHLKYRANFGKNHTDKEEVDLRNDFIQRCKRLTEAYTPDSVSFFLQGNVFGRLVFEKNNIPVPNKVRFLEPHKESIAAYASENLLTGLAVFVFITLGFWGVATGVFDRK